MSDESNKASGPKKKPTKQEQKGKQFEKQIADAIVARNNRIAKLLELNCPDVIIYNEIKMLRELSKGLHSGRLYAQEQQERVKRETDKFTAIQKNRRNLCATVDCENYVSPNMHRPDGEKICTGCIGTFNNARKGHAEP